MLNVMLMMSNDADAWNEADKKAKSIIIKCVSNSHLDYLRDKDSAYDMWKAR